MSPNDMQTQIDALHNVVAKLSKDLGWKPYADIEYKNELFRLLTLRSECDHEAGVYRPNWYGGNKPYHGCYKCGIELTDEMLEEIRKKKEVASSSMCDFCADRGGTGSRCTCQEMPPKKTWECKRCGSWHSTDFTTCPHYVEDRERGVLPVVDPDDPEFRSVSEDPVKAFRESCMPKGEHFNFAGENDYGYMPTGMEQPGVLARKSVCFKCSSDAETAIAKRDQLWREFVTASNADNPSADALDKIWKDVILKGRPKYGDWEYPGMAYRHIVAEFEELKKERDALKERVRSLENINSFADRVIVGIRQGVDINETRTRIQAYDESRGLWSGTLCSKTKFKGKLKKKAKKRK